MLTTLYGKRTFLFVTDAQSITLYMYWRKFHCISVYIFIIVHRKCVQQFYSFIVRTIKVCFRFLRGWLSRKQLLTHGVRASPLGFFYILGFLWAFRIGVLMVSCYFGNNSDPSSAPVCPGRCFCH